MTKKKTSFRKARIEMFFGILGSMLAIFVCGVFLVNHLLEIQTPERLRYVKDYQDFTLTILEAENCSNQIIPLFQLENEIYNGICVQEVYVNYGKVKAPLQMVLENNYINLQDIKKKMSNISDPAEQISHYEYRRSESAVGNYRVTITPKNYQNVVLTEVTFEKFYDKESTASDSASVSVSGELNID